jgi:hypothetical protein
MKYIKKTKHEIKTGVVFNHWTILREVETVNNFRRVECQCVCGTKRIVLFQNLVRNQSKSCGCKGKNRVVNKDNTLIVKNKNTFTKKLNLPPIEWYIEQISQHPNFNVQTIIQLLNKLK